MTFLRYFDSIDNLIEIAGLKKEEPVLKTPKENLLAVLKELHTKLGRVPTTQDVYDDGKYSATMYLRSFGSFSAALKEIGLTAVSNKKEQNICPFCNITTKSLISHVAKTHPEDFKAQEDLVVKLYKEGESSRDLAGRDDLIFNGSSSIVRVVNKYLTKNEIENLRKTKIAKTLKTDYAAGKHEWVNEVNRKRNSTPEAKQKNSEGLKSAYANQERAVWNKGATKETDQRIAEGAKNTSNSMRSLFGGGQIEKKMGSSNANWVENRDDVARRYRLGLGFTTEQRGLIKKRADYKCQNCGVSQEKLEENGKTLECDHIVAIKNGGLNDWETNGKALCPDCHFEKTKSDVCPTTTTI
jgi:5-methylcytosine-specific restriction endonuclease McrA